MLLKGRNTAIYGCVTFGNNVVLEDNVVIGHPSPAELAGCFSELEQYESVEQLYGARSMAPVIIGDNSIIRSGTVIYSGVTIGNNFDCSHNALIRESCRIGDFVYVKAGTIMMSRCVVGSRCRLSGMIGDLTVIEDNVSSFGNLTHRYPGQYTPAMHYDRGPTLHKGCVVGRGALVIGDVHVGEEAYVAAGAVVNFNVPPHLLVTGVLGTARERKILIQ